MTTIDTERFREALLEERRRVEHALATLRDEHAGSLEDEVDEVSGLGEHLADAAAGTLGREIDYTLEENSEGVLVEIDAALQRIEDGTYGICTNNGEQIPVERLEAYPWASLCIDCKRQLEG